MSSETVIAERVSEPLYRVPQRFGMGPILVIMLMLALTFMFLRALQSPPWYHLSIALFFFTVCGAQMWIRREPRFVSSVAGAVFLPVWLLISSAFADLEYNYVVPLIIFSPAIAALGAGCGYLLGALGAGVFLVLDQLHNRRTLKKANPIDELFSMEGPVNAESSQPTDTASERNEHADSVGPAASGPADSATPVVRLVGPPEPLPVFNCQLVVSLENNGVYRARSLMLEGVDEFGKTEREALKMAVESFKRIVKDYHQRNEPIPWLAAPREQRAGETERWIAVHL